MPYGGKVVGTLERSNLVKLARRKPGFCCCSYIETKWPGETSLYAGGRTL
jgi:hypothetical protein